ncbi:hypothetical protein D3C81_761990 [compost metagenome]
MRGRVDATDHDRLAVSHANLGVYLVLADWRHIVQGIDVIWFVLGHPDGHDDLVVRGDLRGDLQRQRRFAKRHGGGATLAGFLVGHLGAFEDSGGFLVGRDDLGLRDDFTIAALFHGTELKVEQDVSPQQAQAHTGGGPFHPKVDEQLFAWPHILGVQGLAPTHAKALFVIDIGFDDARLDRHLAHRHIQLRHQLAQLGKAISGLIRHQGIGARIDAQTASPGQDAVVRQGCQQQLCEL